MQVKGVKSFKVNTIKNQQAGGLTPEEEERLQREHIENFFTGSSESSRGPSKTPNASAVNDYTFGDMEGDAMVGEGIGSDVTGFLTRLANIDTNEILASKEEAVNNLDLIRKRYEKAIQDLMTLQETYEAEISAGGTTAARLEELHAYLDLIGKALGHLDTEIQKVDQLAARLEVDYENEKRAGLDLNGDQWIGRPRASGSLYIKYDEDGNPIYLDPDKKLPVSNYVLDPDLSPELIRGDGITMISKEEAKNGKEGDEADVYLRLDERTLTNLSPDNTFQTPLLFRPMEYLWVRRNGDGEGTDPYREKIRRSGEVVMDAAPWSSDGGSIHQDVPADKSQYMQVLVTEMKLRSVPSGQVDQRGQPLFDTVVEYLHDKRLVSRVRIEGFSVAAKIPPAAQLKDGSFYVAASSVGVGIDGSGRSSSIKIDASEYNSTSRHVVDDLARKLGIQKPGDGGDGDKSFEENINAFSDSDSDYEYTSAGGQDYHDAYVPFDDKCEKKDRLSNATGVFIQGVRGDIMATKYNNVVWSAGVNSPNDYAKEHLPKKIKPVEKGDADYSNSVDLQGGGNNIWVGNRGDNFVFGATLAWVAESNSSDTNYLGMQEVDPIFEGTEIEKPPKNPRLFVHAYSGTTYLYNPHEITPSVLPGEDPKEVEKKARAFVDDDYFDIRGSYNAFDPSDQDLVNKSNGVGKQLDLAGMRSERARAMEGWMDALLKVAEPDGTEVPVDWGEIDGADKENQDELNAFFDEITAGADELLGEQQSPGETGEST